MPEAPTLTGITQRILVRLAGAELPLVELELRATVAEFLARSLLWRERKAITAVPGQGVYCLEIPQKNAGVMASRLLAAFYGKTMLQLGAIVGTVPDETGSPRMADLSNPHQLQVWPVPPVGDEPKSFTLDIVWGMDVSCPTAASLCLPPEVLGFLEVLVDGTLYRMFAMIDKPWSSQKAAVHHYNRYNVGMRQARETADAGRGRTGDSAATRWRYPRFA